jgi:hypothetical protein
MAKLMRFGRMQSKFSLHWVWVWDKATAMARVAAQAMVQVLALELAIAKISAAKVLSKNNRHNSNLVMI